MLLDVPVWGNNIVDVYIMCPGKFLVFSRAGVKGLIIAIFVQEKLLSSHGTASHRKVTSDWATARRRKLDHAGFLLNGIPCDWL